MQRHRRVLDHIFQRIFIVLAVVLTMLAFQPLAANQAKAHEVLPAIVDFYSDAERAGQGQYKLTVRLNAEALLAGIGAEHEDTDNSPQAQTYNALRALAPEALLQRFEAFRRTFTENVVLRFDGERVTPTTVTIEVPPVGDVAEVRESVITMQGALPPTAQSLQWAWPQAFGASVFRLNPVGAERGEGYSAYLGPGEVSEEIAIENTPPRSLGEIVLEYVVIGFDHIIPKGLDHILFVVGLFLLSIHWKPLLWQVTAFTVAHTITLALATLGYVSISPSIVEPLIALSIVYVAVENLFTDKVNPWRPLIVFGFGLLHGLGFADVLGDIGLSAEHFVAGLIAFNVGVELGQLAVIALCYLAVGIWFGSKRWYRSFVTNPASVAIAVIGGWWFYERALLG